MVRPAHAIVIAALLARAFAAAQDTAPGSAPSTSAGDARFGMVMPVTVAGNLIRTRRARAIDPAAGLWNTGFRVAAYPSMKLGARWYFYSAVQLNSEPYFYYDAYYPERDVEVQVPQAFLGYAWTGENSGVSIKVGQLASAFGAFPLRYDEAANPLLDPPLAYSSPLHIRPDALPCGVKDLPNLRLYSEYVGVRFYCGGPHTMHHGLTPVTLYGLPGAEVAVSLGGLDARLQFTNSSPANPQSLWSDSQNLQWTAGAGITLWQGFRVGVSGMRGPFLERSVEDKLPTRATVPDYPATGIGADVQYARGRWSAAAEWMRASFSYPRLFVPVTVQGIYGEIKAILTPRLFAAARGSWQMHNRVADKNGRSSLPFQPNTQAYEISVGFRPNRWQLLKAGYEWQRTDGVSGRRNDVAGIQLVTSFEAFSLALD